MKKLVKEAVTRILLSSSDPKVLELQFERLLRLSHDVHDELRRVRARETQMPPMQSLDGQHTLGVWVLHPQPPWQQLPFEPSGIVGMISDEECRGPTIHRSVLCGCRGGCRAGSVAGPFHPSHSEGTHTEPAFPRKEAACVRRFHLAVEWMDQHLPPLRVRRTIRIFASCSIDTHGLAQGDMIVQRRKIIDHDGNQALAAMTWDAGPIEFLYVDCDRTFAANKAWHRYWSGHSSRTAQSS